MTANTRDGNSERANTRDGHAVTGINTRDEDAMSLLRLQPAYGEGGGRELQIDNFSGPAPTRNNQLGQNICKTCIAL